MIELSGLSRPRPGPQDFSLPFPAPVASALAKIGLWVLKALAPENRGPPSLKRLGQPVDILDFMERFGGGRDEG